jgi:hypothetical protein
MKRELPVLDSRFMVPLVFVHGTGVREPEFSATATRLQEALLGCANLTKCYWGEHHGARLSMDGASIPDYMPPEDLPPPGTVDEVEIELWRLLASDPLYELRLLASTTAPLHADFTLGMRPAQRLDISARRLAYSADMRNILAKHGLTGSFDSVFPRIVGSAVYEAALAHAPEGLAEYRYAIARALVAATSLEARRRGVNGGLPLGYDERAELVDKIVDDLGGKDYGLLGWTWRNVLSGVAKGWGTRYMTRNRQVVSDAAWPLAGDVLLYQTRGEAIRTFIGEQIVAAGPRAVVLAHSLGGIACVDLLVRASLDVRLLITVGSQAPFLYEIGALSSLKTGAPLPDHFPAWVNLYDPRDLLSYVGARVFSGRVKDVCVDNKVAFPESHSAYWTNPAVIEKIRALITA